jgi:sporulation protein YlmC with PRC-barrel domain
MANREIHIEQLLGRKVFDSEGKRAGRLEEVIAVHQGDECVVQEYWIGSYALLHRFSAISVGRSLLGLFGAKGHAGYKVPWDKLDISNPERLRLDCACHELEELTEQDKSARQSKRQRKSKKN